MDIFTVIPVDQGKFGIGRWNKLTQKYDLVNQTYPSKEIAEMAKQAMEDFYNEDNQE